VATNNIIDAKVDNDPKNTRRPPILGAIIKIHNYYLYYDFLHMILYNYRVSFLNAFLATD